MRTGEGKRNRREEKEGGEEGKRNRREEVQSMSKMSTRASRTLQVHLGSLELTSTAFQRTEAG